MSAIKKIWSFFTKKTSTDISSITEKIEELDQSDFVSSEKQVTNDSFFYDTWEKRGSVIYNQRPVSEIKSIVLDCEVRIH
jgi:hypothetical protein